MTRRIALRSEKETGETRELSFGGLRDLVSRLAGALIALGVSRGDAVAVYLPMGEEAVVSLLAVSRIGRSSSRSSRGARGRGRGDGSRTRGQG